MRRLPLPSRFPLVLTGLLLAGCSLQLVTPAARPGPGRAEADLATAAPSASPAATAEPRPTPDFVPSPSPSFASDGPSAAPSAASAFELDGAWLLRFDPPFLGDGGLTPDGTAAVREIEIPLSLSARAGTVAGEANWCPSDYCVSSRASGWLEGAKLTLKLDRDAYGGNAGLVLHGEVRGDTVVGVVSPDAMTGRAPERRFVLSRQAPASPAPAPASPGPSPLSGLHGRWTYAPEGSEGPVMVDACYPRYHDFTFTDPEDDGRDVTLAVRYVQGGGAYMPSRDERLEGGRDPRTGDYVLQGEREASMDGAEAQGGPEAVRYVLKLDALRGRLTGTRSVAGGPVEPIVLGPLAQASPPPDGCGPPPP